VFAGSGSLLPVHLLGSLPVSSATLVDTAAVATAVPMIIALYISKDPSKDQVVGTGAVLVTQLQCLARHSRATHKGARGSWGTGTKPSLAEIRSRSSTTSVGGGGDVSSEVSSRWGIG
jgi:hypothetical protein